VNVRVNTSMKHRKLRIAWSVGWGVVGLLLTVCWIRSQYYVDSISFPITDGRMLGLESNRNEVCMYSNNFTPGYYGAAWGREYPWDMRSDDVKWYNSPARTADEFVGVLGLGVN
jgi:hypothetical protein